MWFNHQADYTYDKGGFTGVNGDYCPNMVYISGVSKNEKLFTVTHWADGTGSPPAVPQICYADVTSSMRLVDMPGSDRSIEKEFEEFKVANKVTDMAEILGSFPGMMHRHPVSENSVEVQCNVWLLATCTA